jgi:hypothetical protein
LNSVFEAGLRSSETLEVISVQALTYKNFIRVSAIRQLDLFILDVERHEIQVITGMFGADVLPLVFCIECWDEDAFEKVNALVKQLGYIFDVLAYNNYIFVLNS